MNTNSKTRLVSGLRTTVIICVVGFFFLVPLLFLLYGGLAAALSSLVFMTVFAIFQLPVFLILRHFGLVPPISLGLPASPEESLIAGSHPDENIISGQTNTVSN